MSNNITEATSVPWLIHQLNEWRKHEGQSLRVRHVDLSPPAVCWAVWGARGSRGGGFWRGGSVRPPQSFPSVLRVLELRGWEGHQWSESVSWRRLWLCVPPAGAVLWLTGLRGTGDPPSEESVSCRCRRWWGWEGCRSAFAPPLEWLSWGLAPLWLWYDGLWWWWSFLCL